MPILMVIFEFQGRLIVRDHNVPLLDVTIQFYSLETAVLPVQNVSMEGRHSKI